jgi:hypothetical protein
MGSAMRTSMLTAVLALAACNGGSSSVDAPPGSPDGPPAFDAAPPAAVGMIPLEACRGLNGIDENCLLVTDASACTAGRCSKLVVVFTGGDQGCENAAYTNVLAGFAALGDWAAVCINYFETSDGSGAVPYLDEQGRIDLALREATTGPWGRAYWTGAHLLLQGISHGATAPVIVMARTTLDDQPHWHGATTTGGCFFDGSYDQYATAELLRTGAIGGNPCTFPVPYQRWLDRYCGVGNTCDLQTEPSAVADTITGVLPLTFAIHDLRLIECGSALAVCTADILPAAPIQELCTRIDSGPDHQCTFDALPGSSHLACHQASWDDCRTWFEGLIP